MVGLSVGECCSTSNPVFLLEFLRISGKSGLISDLSLQRRHAVRQPVAQLIPRIAQYNVTSDSPPELATIFKDTIQSTLSDSTNSCDVASIEEYLRFTRTTRTPTPELFPPTTPNDQNSWTHKLPRCLQQKNSALFD